MNRDSKFKDLLPEYIRQKIRKKHNLWKRYMETKLQETYKEYCRIRNKVKNMITYFRKQKEKNISMNIKQNPKAFWNYIKSKTKTKSSITGLHCDPTDETSRITDNDSYKADILNKYFASVFTKEPQGEVPSFEKRTQSEMCFPIIKKETIETHLKNMDATKSPSPDGHHPRFMKEIAQYISEPLCTIFQTSILLGIVPSQWRNARVSAIYKKGNKKLASNYRPVSITSILCRILETIIRNEIIDFMQTENLISDYQFGFIKGRSTSLQLLNIIYDWTNSIENCNFSDCVYLDYQKAFDTVPHKRLIKKLAAYNIHEKIINWITYYLSERKQYVEISGMKSEWESVSSGIPQGSVLGPLLFLIYINDLPDGIESTIYMYADDTKLYREINSPDDHIILQKDLEKLCIWSEKWLLKFHPNKCSILSIGKQTSTYDYKLVSRNDSHKIEYVKFIKDIGVTMDSALTFDQHINIKINTANKILGIIRRSYRFLNCETFLPLYKCMVRSYFDYAVCVWDPYRIKHIQEIEDVQRRATKLIPEIKNFTYPERLKKLGLPTLAFRRIRGHMIEVYKIINDMYDNRVTGNLLTFRNKATVNLRGNEYTLDQKRIYKPECKNFFSNKVVTIWNTLPNSVVDANSLNIFKNRLDKLWDNQELLTNYRSVIDKKIYDKFI